MLLIAAAFSTTNATLTAVGEIPCQPNLLRHGATECVRNPQMFALEPEPPCSKLALSTQPNGLPMPQRPISVTVFGILNIGYALYKFFGLLMMIVIMRMNLPGISALAAMRSDPAYQAWIHFSVVAGIVLGVVLIASGIGLLFLQNWARIVAVIYSVLDIIVVVAGALFSPRVMPQAVMSQAHGAQAAVFELSAKIGMVIGVGIGLVYPVLLLIFMTRPKIIEAFKSPQLQEPH
jgi:hypothetical protein